MAYTTTKRPDGLYEVFKDGQRIATGTASILSQYGLSPATAPAPTPTPAPTPATPPSTPSTLTPSQIQQYYTSEGGKTNPLSPLAWLAQQGQPPTPPVSMYISTGDPKYDALLKANQDLLDRLSSQGQYLNPNIQLTQDQLAEFMSKAQGEIDPYYATQLKLAKETLLKSIGYTTEGIQRYEADAERKYGQNVRTLGESAAEKGFALSGIRQRSEQDLAYTTQQDIENQRRQLGYETGNLARTFTQQWSGVPGYEQPTTNIPQTPTVQPGEITFQRSGAETPFYTISPDTYQGLIGEKQKERLTGTRTLADYYGELARQGQNINTIRKLTI